MSKDMSSTLIKHLREKTKMQVIENVLKYRKSSEKKQNTGAAEEVKEQRDFGETYVSIIPHNTLSNSSFLFQFALSNKGEKEQSPVEKKQKTGDALEGTATMENSSSSSKKTQNTGAASKDMSSEDMEKRGREREERNALTKHLTEKTKLQVIENILKYDRRIKETK